MAEKAFNTMARLNFGAWALAGIAVIAVSGCGDIRVGPAGRTQQAATAQQPCDRDMSGARTVYVCLGDTLSGLARLKNVTVANLMKANGLSDDQIQAGSTLVLPDEYVHVVQPGETVLGISRQTNVSSDAIIAANDLTNADRLLPETRLAIPRSGNQIAARPVVNQSPLLTVPTTPASAPQAAPVPAQQNTQPQIWPSITIAKQPAATTITPAPSTGPPAGTNNEQVASVAPQGAPAGVNQPQPRRRPAQAPSSAPVATTSAPKTAPAVTKPAVKAAPSFLLPVEGKILSDFGPKSGGLHNDGINIAAARGTPIRATANGTVAYAGDGLPGFGNLVLIKHADGWTSAYAHADSIAVKRGDAVRQGQTIGEIGATGTVNEPQLHFELRQHDRAVDPKKMVQ